MPIVKINKCLNCDISHEWIFSSLRLKEYRVIKQLTGMTQADFRDAGDNDDPEALAVLLYLMHVRDDIKIPFDEIDLDFDDFSMGLTEAEQKQKDIADAEAAKAARNAGPKKNKSGMTEKAG